jgi:hypothetical protein
MKISRRWVIVCIVLLVVLFLIVAQFSVHPGNVLLTAAAALSVVTVAAVGIERAIELIWTMVGMTKGTWWPFNLMNERVAEIEAGLNDVLTPIQNQAQLLATGAAQGTKLNPEDVAVVEKALNDIRQQMAQLQVMAPSAQRANLIAATALQGVSYIEQRYPDLQSATTAVNQAAVGLADFVATFKDNPARRVLSIYAGMLLGLVVAGALGLDLFAATGVPVNAAATGEPASPLLPFLGVAATGLLLGLGANPTHEVIKFIQEAKVNRREANAPAPVVQPAAVMPTVVMVPQAAPAAPAPLPEGAAPRGAQPQAASQQVSQGLPAPRGVNTLSLRRR